MQLVTPLAAIIQVLLDELALGLREQPPDKIQTLLISEMLLHRYPFVMKYHVQEGVRRHYGVPLAFRASALSRHLVHGGLWPAHAHLVGKLDPLSLRLLRKQRYGL